MLDDIQTLGLSDDFYNEMLEKLGYDLTLNVACNCEKVKANIEILENFGIKNIESLLLNKTQIFFLDNEDLIKKFAQYNIPIVVNLINNDYTIIDDLF